MFVPWSIPEYQGEDSVGNVNNFQTQDTQIKHGDHNNYCHQDRIPLHQVNSRDGTIESFTTPYRSTCGHCGTTETQQAITKSWSLNSTGFPDSLSKCQRGWRYSERL